jgi:hypothetical protein
MHTNNSKKKTLLLLLLLLLLFLLLLLLRLLPHTQRRCESNYHKNSRQYVPETANMTTAA